MAEFQKRKIGGDDDINILRQQTPGKEKTVYLEIDDEVTTVYDRIKRLRNNEIYLVIPKKAVMLQSIVNLRILKKKSDELGKKITIITNDHIGQKLAEQAAIAVFEKFPGLESEKKTPSFSMHPPSESPPSAPFRPTRLLERKQSITDLLKKGASASDPLVRKIIEWFRKRKKKKKYTTEITIVTPSKPALITLITITIFLFFGIAYIALPGATVTMTPASSRIEQPVNVTLLDFEKNQSLLESRPTQTIASFTIRPPTVEKILSFPATGKNFQGTNARGTITITNESPNSWPLVEETRFQTADGLVFRIKRAITVPPTRGTTAGNLDAEVVADAFDASGQIIGERGNIDASVKFFLPGLKNAENRKKLHAVSKTVFTGGTSKVIKTVSEEDIKAATERAKKEILLAAKEELKKFLETQNAQRNTLLTLLADPRTVTTTEPKISLVGEPVGKEIETFDMKASIDITGIAFHERELLNLLRAEMSSRKSPEKKIVSIVEDSLTHRIFDIDLAAGKIRLTATLRGIEQYDIDPESEVGARIIKTVKDHIAGKDLDEATFFMQNLPEIDRVEIKSWPFWAPTLPTVPDNIEFAIQNEASAENPENSEIPLESSKEI